MECNKCRTPEDKRNCGGKDFYNYGEIRFCVWQVQWIISQFLGLDNGEIYIKIFDWPPDPSGKSDTTFDPRSRRVNTEAAFCKPMEIVGEVAWRLMRLGRLGERLVSAILSGNELDNEMQSALIYVSGWRRREILYYQWRNKVMGLGI